MNGPSHQFNVNNVQLASTSPYLAKYTSICTIYGLNRPSGVAVSNDGHVIVTEFMDNCIRVLEKSKIIYRNINFG